MQETRTKINEPIKVPYFDWDRLKLLFRLSDSNIKDMIIVMEVTEIDGESLEVIVYQRCSLRSLTVIFSGKLTVVAGKPMVILCDTCSFTFCL
jgi:hypothetical protein